MTVAVQVWVSLIVIGSRGAARINPQYIFQVRRRCHSLSTWLHSRTIIFIQCRIFLPIEDWSCGLRRHEARIRPLWGSEAGAELFHPDNHASVSTSTLPVDLHGLYTWLRLSALELLDSFLLASLFNMCSLGILLYWHLVGMTLQELLSCMLFRLWMLGRRSMNDVGIVAKDFSVAHRVELLL